MATVRKRTWQSGGETQTAWIANYTDSGGKRRLKTFPTKKAADAWLVEARHQLARGTHTPEAASDTVAKAAALWLERGEVEGLERSTLTERESHMRIHINPALGGMKLARLTTPVVESFVDGLLRKNSRPMCRKILVSLKSILKDAKRRGNVAQNVASDVRVDLKRRERERLRVGVDIPTKAEARAIIDAAEPRWRPVLITALFAGLRASEMRGLTWSCVDFDSRTISVRRRMDRWNSMGAPKSAAGRRDVPMSPLVLNTLREWRPACPRTDAGLVFPNSVGRPEKHFRDIGLHRALKAAGIGRRYKFHALRHWYASWLIDQGFSPKRVQTLMGHNSITVTLDTYGHLFPNEADDHARLAAGELAVIGS